MKDTFRKSYKQINVSNSELIIQMKETAEKLEALFMLLQSREMSIAITNLEQAMMWATKGIVIEDERNGSVPIVCVKHDQVK